MKKGLLVALAVSIFLLWGVQMAGADNLALGKPTTASSICSPGYEAEKAVDGDFNTGWVSETNITPQWIRLDLAASYDINRVILDWVVVDVMSYEIQVSDDDSNWATVYSTTTGDGGIDNISFEAVNTRYVRVYCTKYGEYPIFSLQRFEVYEALEEPNPDVVEILTNVIGSTAYRYNVEDDTGKRLDTLKIIENPNGGYLGVYHSYAGGEFQIRLATSTDLINWIYKTTLAPNSSQPTLAYHAEADAYLLVHEQWMNPNSIWPARLKFQYYSSLDDLLNANPSRTYLAPSILSFLEGTPNVYNISDDGNTIEVGFHFYNNTRDVSVRGTLTNFLSENPGWQTEIQTDYNNKLISKGVNGNIGDRDYGWIFKGEYNIQEGQLASGDWASWRVWLYDYELEDFTFLNVRTHGVSIAFANPTFTVLTSPNNLPCVVVTYFLPREGAAPGELAQLIFYTEYQEDSAK